MFNVGPLELLVLAIVGVVVVGPDRLPNLARDAARIIRQLRELANGARTQLRDELGPEFADVDLRNLNPRTALQRAVLGEDLDLGKFDPRRWDARSAAENLLRDDVPDASSASSASSAASGQSWVSTDAPVSMRKQSTAAAPALRSTAMRSTTQPGERPRPRPRPTPRAEHGADSAHVRYDTDAT